MKRNDGVNRRRGRLSGASAMAKGRSRGRLRPELQALEDRRLLATFNVTSTTDGVDSQGNGLSGTLRWAVQQADLANAPSTITFGLGTPATITLSQLLKPIELSNLNQPITIDGPGASLLTIDAHDEGAALRIDQGVTATITGLTVTNASLDVGNNGGAISNIGTLSISDCTLSGNTISGIYDKGTATITDCTVVGNNSFFGAGIFIKGSATVTGCTIENNQGARGAGICDYQGTATVTDCTITGNSALGAGGGLYNSGLLTLAASTIDSNTGAGGGGLDNLKGGTATVSDCTIRNGSGFMDGGNLQDEYGGTLNVSDCTITGGSALTGGGLYNDGTTTIERCTISGNTATGASGGGSGGGIANGPLQDKAVLNVVDSTIMDNTAEFNGGGLYNNGTASLSNDTIADNFADQGGSLLASNGGGVDNTGTATLVACTITGNATTAKGGGVYNGGLGPNAMTINDTIIAGNTRSPAGSPSDVEVGSSPTAPYDINGSDDLVGTGGDGGLAQGSTNGKANVGNKVGVADPGLAPLDDYGGPTWTVALLPGSPAIAAGSQALELDPGGQALTGDQRGFAFDTPAPDIGAFQAATASLVVQSTGDGAGVPLGALDLRGAVDLANLRTSKASITFDPTAFTSPQTIILTHGPLELSNTAAAISIKGSGGGLTVSGHLAGRVFQVDQGVTATIANLTITQGLSRTTDAGPDPGLGGGLLNLGTTTLNNCTISGNFAADGGGLGNAPSGTLALNNGTVGGNSASSSGGGLYNLGTSSLSNSTIAGNTAQADGGGVYDRTGAITLGGCTVAGNSAVGGAGLFLDGPATLTASTISGNSTGGGIEDAGNPVTLVDCTIAGNSERGLNNQFGQVTLIACTVTGNSDYGLANYGNPSSPGTIAMTDTIVAGNALNGGPTDIGGTDPSDVTGTSNLIGTGGSGGIAVGTGGNIVGVANPLLAPLGNYGGPTQTIALLPGSPALHAGTAATDPNGHAISTDARGEPLDAPAPDIGAFQSQGFTITPVAGSTPQTAATGRPFANLLAVTVAANNPDEPVSGGVITFAAPSSGASASLTGTTAVVGPTGQASVGATANATAGSYDVTASAAGAAAPATFSLSNLIGLTFGGLSNPATTYGQTTTFTGTLLASGGQAPTGEDVTVTVNGHSATGPVAADGSFSVTVDTSTLQVSAPAYPVTYSYASDGTYAPATASGSLTISPAAPTVAVADPSGSYTGSAFAATATVAGIGLQPAASLEGVTPTLAYYSGTYTATAQLSGVKPLSGAPIQVGAYTVLASFAGSTDYAAGTAIANFSVAPATPTVAVHDAGGPYTGSAFKATATVAGVGGTPGSTLENVSPTLTYYSGTYTDPSQLSGLTPIAGAPGQAGAYTVLATFAGSADYAAGKAIADFSITPATPTVSVAAAGGKYGSSIAPASATITGVTGPASSQLEGVGLTLAYYSGTYSSASQLSGLTPIAGAPGQAGAYTVLATFAGSADYAAASGLANFAIALASPVLAVSNAGGTFDGSAFSTADTVAGVVAGVDNTPGPQLEGVGLTLSYFAGTYTQPSQLAGATPLAQPPTSAGAYTVEVRFAGSADYAPAAAIAGFTIARAAPTVTVNDAGGTYGASTFPATADVAGVVSGVDSTPAATLEGIAPTLTYYSGTYTTTAQLENATPLANGAPILAGAYTVEASFAGGADYAPAAVLANFTIAPATPTVAVSDAGGTYDGTAFPATATVAGVSGTPVSSLENATPALTYYSGTYTTTAQLTGHSSLAGAPTHAGAYTVLATFPGSTDYAKATAMANFTIGQATTQLTWNAPAGIVFGTPLSSTQLDATASVPGVPVYTPGVGAILGAGTGQALSVTFTPTDSVDYSTAHATATIDVAPATPTIRVSAPGGSFNGSPFAAAVTIAGSDGASPAASLEDVAPILNYYQGPGTSGTPLGSTPPSAPGTYTVVARFPGSADYNAVTAEPVTFTITPAVAALSLSTSGGSATYGQPVTLTATVTGAPAAGGSVTFYDDGAPIGSAALDPAGVASITTAALPVGGHSITASYSGAGGQVSATSAASTETIAQAPAQVALVPTPILKGKKVKGLILEAQVHPATAGGPAPTGSVTFEIVTRKGKGKHARTTVKVLGTAALSGGSAGITVKPNQVLKKPITILYGGDAGFLSTSVTPPALTSASLKALERPMLSLLRRGR